MAADEEKIVDRKVGVWSRIGTDFDPDEETANFGTRHALEAEGKLFDVFTYATIGPEGPVEKNPLIRSRLNPDLVGLALDSFLYVFEHDFQSNFSVQFSAEILVLEWTPCARFLAVGLANGHAHLVHMGSKKPLPQFDFKLEESEKFVGLSIVEENEAKSSLDLAFVTDKNNVAKLCNVDFDKLHQGLESHDYAKLKSIRDDEIVTRCDKFDHFGLNPTTLLTNWTNNRAIISGDKSVAILDHKNQLIRDVLELDSDPAILAVPRRSHRNLLFCVDFHGKLSIICVNTMIKIGQWNQEIIQDLVFLEDEGDPVLKLLMVTTRKNSATNEDETLLQIREFPQFNILYELKVSRYCRLLDTCVNQESPLVLEGSGADPDDDNDNELIKLLKVRGICEGNPDARLARLLRRGKFDEAEKFAHLNGQSLEEVHQSRAVHLMNILSPWKSKEVNLKSTLDELITTLTRMKNLEFMVKCCLNVTLRDLKSVRKLLILARNAIQNNIDEDLDNALMASVSKALHRLETFTFVHRSGGGIETDTLEMVEAWIKFSRSDMLQECQRLVQTGQMSSALLVWQRHQGEFGSSLSPELIEMCLCQLPANNGPDKLRFLQRFLPDCLRLCKEKARCLNNIARWAINTARSMEKQRSSWPETGLTFAQAIYKALVEECGSNDNSEDGLGGLLEAQFPLLLRQQSADRSTDLYRLTVLIDTLTDLRVVHKKFRLKIKLDDFIMHDKQEVAGVLLDWCATPAEMESLLNGFLLAYLKKFGLDFNLVLCKYVHGLIEETGFCWYWDAAGNAPWEKKVSMLTSHVTSASQKVKVILCALKAAPVPWSEDMTALASLGSRLNHPGSFLIKEQEKLVALKQIVLRYSAGKSYSVEGREAERLLQRILKAGGRTCYQDALTAAGLLHGVEERDARRLQIYQLLLSDHHKEAVGLLKEDVACLEEAVELVERVLLRAQISLPLTAKSELEDLEPTILFLKASPFILNAKLVKKATLQRPEEMKAKVQEVTESIGVVSRLYTLKTDYNIDLAALDNTDDKVEAFKYWLNGPQDNLAKTYVTLAKLSNLLLMPLLDLLGLFLLNLIHKDNFQDIVQLCQVLLDQGFKRSPELAHYLDQFLSMASTKAVQEGDLLSTLCDVSSWNVEACDCSALPDALLVSQWYHHAMDLHRQFHNRQIFTSHYEDSDGLGLLMQRLTRNHFRDKGLPLDSCSIKGPMMIQSKLRTAKDNKARPYLPNNTFCINKGHKEPSSKEEGCVTPPPENEDQATEAANVSALEMLDEIEAHCSMLLSQGHTSLALAGCRLLEWPLTLLALEGSMGTVTGVVHPRFRSILIQVTAGIVPKILADQRPDLPLALAHLLGGMTKATSGLKVLAGANANLGTNYSKVAFLARLGERFSARSGLCAEKDQFCGLLVKAAWGQRMALSGVDFRDIFTGGSNHSAVLEQLVNKDATKVSIDELQKYANAFDLSCSDTMELFVKTMLTSPGLDPIMSSGKGQQDARFAQILMMVSAGLQTMPVEQRLNLLQTLFTEALSPYNYEVLQIVLTEWKKLCQSEDLANEEILKYIHRAENVLCFLTNYKRCHKVSEEESDKWPESHSTPFPWTIANQRLPLHPILESMGSSKDIFRLLSNEFTIETFQAWVGVAKLFRLTADNIRVATVQNSVAKLLPPHQGQQDEAKWILEPTIDKAALDKIFECLDGIVDLYKAPSAAHWVVNRLPKGQDKLSAAFACQRFAERWHSEVNDAASVKGLAFAKQTHLKLKVEHTLTLHGLEGQTQYMELLHQCRMYDLVLALYGDSSIVKRCKGQDRSWPDINRAAAEIAEAVDDHSVVNLTELKYSLLDKWLPEKNSSSSNGKYSNDLDETVTDFNIMQQLADGWKNQEMAGNENEDNYWKCVYILEGFAEAGQQEGIDYLLHITFSQDPSLSNAHKLRTLKCLLSVVGGQTLEDTLGHSVEELEKRFQGLYFVSKLESLNLPYPSVEAFEACDKTALIESVLRSCGHLSEGIALVVDLCLSFGIFLPSLWEGLFARLVRLNGGRGQLRHALLGVGQQVPCLWHLSSFRTAWNCLLLNPFRSASTDSIRECRSTLQLLQRCPISADLEISQLTVLCQKLDLNQELEQTLKPILTLLEQCSENCR